jgi:hypothetical protein
MSLTPKVDMIDNRDAHDIAGMYKMPLRVLRSAPKRREGDPGTMVLVDNGSTARLYIKGKKRWWSCDLEEV